MDRSDGAWGAPMDHSGGARGTDVCCGAVMMGLGGAVFGLDVHCKGKRVELDLMGTAVGRW